METEGYRSNSPKLPFHRPCKSELCKRSDSECYIMDNRSQTPQKLATGMPVAESSIFLAEMSALLSLSCYNRNIIAHEWIHIQRLN